MPRKKIYPDTQALEATMLRMILSGNISFEPKTFTITTAREKLNILKGNYTLEHRATQKDINATIKQIRKDIIKEIGKIPCVFQLYDNNEEVGLRLNIRYDTRANTQIPCINLKYFYGYNISMVTP